MVPRLGRPDLGSTVIATRVVLILVDIAFAALLVAIMVGAFRSGGTDEVDHPKVEHVRQRIAELSLGFR